MGGVGVILFLVMATMRLCTAAVHEVGGSAGWTIVGFPDYKKWASNKTFHVGDTLVFAYHKQYHNVEEVNHREYTTCNTNSPKATYHSGFDSINLTRPGDYYFICGNGDHCLSGQKLHIKVHSSSLSLLVTTSPILGPRLSPTLTTAPQDMLTSSVSAHDSDPSTNNAAIFGSSSVTAAAFLALGPFLV